jgi:hypothetical protein
VASWQTKFQYYQGICIRAAKDLDLLQPPPELTSLDITGASALSPLQQQEFLTKLRNIEKHRASLDLLQQEELMYTLEDQLNFNQAMQHLTRDYRLYNCAMRELFQDLIRVGVIPAVKLATGKKTQFDQQGVTLSISDSDRTSLYNLFEELQKQSNQNFNDKAPYSKPIPHGSHH